MDIIKTFDLATFECTKVSAEGMVCKTTYSISATVEDTDVYASCNLRSDFRFTLGSESFPHLAMIVIILILISGFSD